MAKEGVYGEAGKPNESPTFAIPGIGGVLSVEVNKQSGVTQIYRQGTGNTQQSLGTYSPSTKKFTPDPNSNLSDNEKKALSSPEGINAITGAAKTTATKGIQATGVDAKNAGDKANTLISPNTSSNAGIGTTSTGVDPNEGFLAGTREKYGDFKYPINLKSEHQDCIKFTIQKYVPSLASSVSPTSPDSSASSTPPPNNTNTNTGKRDILGTITLPIPTGINDSNTVNWQSAEINELKQQITLPTVSFLSGGTGSATSSLERTSESAQQMLGSGDAKKALVSVLASSALQANDLQQRIYGTIINNNLELLFNGPSLRSFSFTFKLSPREPDEAKEIMLIIRSFKQAMSTKRSSSTLLLKTPHTFKIQYLSSNKDHPYLNKFKECALTGFNVDYTPEGQYMTYMSSNLNERSMISYVLSMTFQELEPVYDDEYGNEPLTRKDIKNIGY